MADAAVGLTLGVIGRFQLIILTNPNTTDLVVFPATDSHTHSTGNDSSHSRVRVHLSVGLFDE